MLYAILGYLAILVALGLAQHEQLNFGPQQTGAAEAIPPDERARVLRMLRS